MDKKSKETTPNTDTNIATEINKNQDSNEPIQKNSNKKVLACAIILLAILIVAFVVVFCQKTPNNTLEEATNNFLKAENIGFESENSFEYHNPEISGAKNIKINVSASSLKVPADLSVNIDFKTKDDDIISADLQAKITDDQKLFVKTSNLEDFLDELALAKPFEAIYGKDSYREAISNLDGEWWEVDDTSLSEVYQLFGLSKTDNSLACFVEKSQKFTPNNFNFVAATAIKDDDNTFELRTDSDKMTDFIIEPLGCFNNIEKTDLSDFLAGFLGERSKVYVDTNDKNQFSEVYFYEDDNGQYSISSRTKLLYDQKTNFSLPDSYSPFSVFIDLIESQIIIKNS